MPPEKFEKSGRLVFATFIRSYRKVQSLGNPQPRPFLALHENGQTYNISRDMLISRKGMQVAKIMPDLSILGITELMESPSPRWANESHGSAPCVI